MEKSCFLSGLNDYLTIFDAISQVKAKIIFIGTLTCPQHCGNIFDYYKNVSQDIYTNSDITFLCYDNCSVHIFLIASSPLPRHSYSRKRALCEV